MIKTDSLRNTASQMQKSLWFNYVNYSFVCFYNEIVLVFIKQKIFGRTSSNHNYHSKLDGDVHWKNLHLNLFLRTLILWKKLPYAFKKYFGIYSSKSLVSSLVLIISLLKLP